MKKIIAGLVLAILAGISPVVTFAQNNSFVTIINPVRGAEFWEKGRSDSPLTSLQGEYQVISQNSLAASWLLRFDALANSQITSLLKGQPHQEPGLFLEVIPSLAKSAQVQYNNSPSWHFAESVLLTGYTPGNRQKLIDRQFDKFKEVFGYFPKTVGAWWIDAGSLSYMKEKYQIAVALVVADQYTTDNYQVWGQYWGYPYYPSRANTQSPAQSADAKIGVVVMQWASRDPFNGYGNGVAESTFSVQANDYVTYHKLNTDYFGKLVDIYTNTKFNGFGQLTIGLENDYSWQKYGHEYQNQIKLIAQKQQAGNISVVTASEFASWYQKQFPTISPVMVLSADDPQGGNGKVVWYMSPYYRAGYFFNNQGSMIRDMRLYNDSQKELCYDVSCQTLNLATTASKALDEVTFGQQILFDDGKITDFKVEKRQDQVTISYSNQSGKQRTITFLPQDINLDGKITAVSEAIINAISQKPSLKSKDQLYDGKQILPEVNWQKLFLGLVWFWMIAVMAFFTIGRICVKQLKLPLDPLEERVMSWVLGIVIFTLINYLLGWLSVRPLVLPLVLLSVLWYLKEFGLKDLLPKWPKDNLVLAVIVLSGVAVQSLVVVKSGLEFNYGLGFWGPNGHDAIWHLAVIQELLQNFPPQNPNYAHELLKNYHYFYDLWMSSLARLSSIDLLDLYFRFTPLLISALYGISVYTFTKRLSGHNLPSLIAVFLAYFAGSFGWILSIVRGGDFYGGESAFWANQPSTMLLNMPFALSAPIFFCALLSLLLFLERKQGFMVVAILFGALIEFKAYGGLLLLSSLASLAGVDFIKNRSVVLIKPLLVAIVIALVVFLPNNFGSSALFQFQPLWFIHTMLQSPDRVFWPRLDLAIISGQENANWLKFTAASSLGILIFIIGNLGLRSLGIITWIKWIIFSVRKETVDPKNNLHFFLLILSVMAIMAPMLFVQKGNPWNAIQFFYYVVLVFNVLAAISIAKILSPFPTTIRSLLLAMLLILAVPTTIAIFYTYLPDRAPARISKEEYQALKFLQNQDRRVVLTYPYQPRAKEKFLEPLPLFAYDTTAYVTALSGHPSYLDDLMNNQIMDYDIAGRLSGQKEFFRTGDFYWAKQFLKDNKIGYIYVRVDQPWSPDMGNYNIKEIFANDQVKIYRTLE